MAGSLADWMNAYLGELSGDVLFKPVERAGPAIVVTIGRSLVEELFVLQRQQRAGAIGLERPPSPAIPVPASSARPS
jgi:hypothetical protein